MLEPRSRPRPRRRPRMDACFTEDEDEEEDEDEQENLATFYPLYGCGWSGLESKVVPSARRARMLFSSVQGTSFRADIYRVLRVPGEDVHVYGFFGCGRAASSSESSNPGQYGREFTDA